MEFVIDQNVKYVNLCQHDINVLPPSGDEAEMMTVPPSGVVARCASKEVVKREIGRFNGLDMEFGEVTDLPASEPNTIFIASRPRCGEGGTPGCSCSWAHGNARLW